MVLPLPHVIPCSPRPGSAASRPTWSASAAPTSRPDRGPHLRPARRVDARAGVRRARPARGHPRRPGLGRPDRAAPGRRAPRPVRPRGRGQHRAAHRRPADARASGWQFREVVAGRARARRRRGSSRPAARTRCPTVRGRPTTRRSPTTPTRPGRARCPGLVPTRPTTRRRAANRAAWEALTQGTTAVPGRFSDSDPITGPMAPDLQQPDARRAGRRPPDHRGRRPLPAGGRRRGARPRPLFGFWTARLTLLPISRRL